MFFFFVEDRWFGGRRWLRGYGTGDGDIASTLGTLNDKTCPRLIYNHALTTRATLKRDVHAPPDLKAELIVFPAREQEIFSATMLDLAVGHRDNTPANPDPILRSAAAG